jgi:hypothetical protein
VPHLGGGQRTGGLGRHEQPEPAGIRVAAHRRS